MSKRLLISLGVTLLIATLFFYLSPKNVVETMRQVEIHWNYLPLFLLAVGANLYLRGKTLALLVDSQIPIPTRHWLAISTAHNLSTSVSGMLLGDAILFWLLGRFNITWQKSLFTTLTARLFELPMLLVFFCVGLASMPALFPGQQLTTLLAWLALAMSLLLVFSVDRLVNLAPRWLWLGQTAKVIAFSEAYRSLSARCMGPLLLFSAGKILTGFLFFICAMRLFGSDLSFWQECFVFGIFTFAIALPIQGIMGLGTFEAYFSIGLVLLGWAASRAMVLGFLVHMLFLATFITAVVLILPFAMPAIRRSGQG